MGIVYLFMDMFYFTSRDLVSGLLRGLEEILSEQEGEQNYHAPYLCQISTIVGSTGNAGLYSSNKGGVGSTARDLEGNGSMKREGSAFLQAKEIHQNLRDQYL